MQSMDGLVKTGLVPRLSASLQQLGTALLDLVYPPVCLACAAPVAAADTLCPACFVQLRPITAPLCPVLGLPFAVSMGPGAISAEAMAEPPPFQRARAAVVYGEVPKAIVAKLKYGDRPELARFCARLMAGAGHALWRDAPVLVPVPLHRSRLRERRYNQSAELARALGRLTGLSVEANLVARTRRTRQQVGLSGTGRARNVAGAFAVDPQAALRLGARRVVLVDDVYTTGATVKAVCQALRRAKINDIDVVTFARVVVGDDAPIYDAM